MNLTFPGPTVPIELVEAIIDHLRSNEWSLKACSLVCKAWTQRARFNLFGRLDLRARVAKRVLSSEYRVKMIPFIRQLHLIPSWYESTHGTRLFQCSSASTMSDIWNCSASRWEAQRPPSVRHSSANWLTSSTDVSPWSRGPVSLHSLKLSVPNSIDWLSKIMPAQSNLRAFQATGPKHGVVLEWLLSLHAIPALHSLCLGHELFQNSQITIKLFESLLGGACLYAVDSFLFPQYVHSISLLYSHDQTRINNRFSTSAVYSRSLRRHIPLSFEAILIQHHVSKLGGYYFPVCPERRPRGVLSRP